MKDYSKLAPPGATHYRLTTWSKNLRFYKKEDYTWFWFIPTNYYKWKKSELEVDKLKDLQPLRKTKKILEIY